jgi:hypothetical protein
MDRRSFLTGVGTIGAATAGGLSIIRGDARGARASGLANAAGAGVAAGASEKGLLDRRRASLTLGYLPGSPGLLDAAARGERWDHFASQMRWATWHPSLSYPTHEDRVDVAIGTLQSARVWAAPGLVRSIQIVAHFALDAAPDFAPFDAWSYEGETMGKRSKASSAVVFEAGMPDRVGLQVNYAFARENLVYNLAETGMVYLPIGARDGPGTGLYVLASPSRVTGALPDFTEYRFSGNLNEPLLRVTGGATDFDFVPLTIAPVTA